MEEGIIGTLGTKVTLGNFNDGHFVKTTSPSKSRSDANL